MSLNTESASLIEEALRTLSSGFDKLPAYKQEVNIETLRSVLLEVATRMQDNYPYHHPFYIGHMLKPPHPIAGLAYQLSMWINPNNHSFDGGRASSAMEKEAVAHIAHMFGWDTHLGHLCSGGTMANLEALWIAKCLNPGGTILASSQSHFTHERICAVLGIPFEFVSCDNRGRMDIQSLNGDCRLGSIAGSSTVVGRSVGGCAAARSCGGCRFWSWHSG